MSSETKEKKVYPPSKALKRKVSSYPDDDTVQRLDAYKAKTGKSESSLVARLLSDFFKKNPQYIPNVESK